MEIKQLEPLCEEAFLSHIKCTDIFIWSNIQSLLAPVLVSSHTIFQEKKTKENSKCCLSATLTFSSYLLHLKAKLMRTKRMRKTLIWTF